MKYQALILTAALREDGRITYSLKPLANIYEKRKKQVAIVKPGSM
jgi:hypothetical protein